MGRIIAIGIIVIILVVIFILFLMYLSRSDDKVKGDLTFKEERRQRELLTEAAKTFASIGQGFDIDNLDILTETTRTNINEWLDDYRKYRKEIESA